MSVPILPRARTRPRWTAELVHPDGDRQPLPLDAALPPTFTWDKSRQSPLGGRIAGIGRPPEMRFGQHIAVAYQCDETEPVHLPPLHPSIPDEVHDRDGDWWELDVIDLTIILARDGLDFAQLLEPGTPAVAAMAALAAQSAPTLPVAWPATDATLRAPMELGLSSDPLSNINRLAETVGATRLAPRLDGTLASQLWVPAAERPRAAVFGPGDGAGFIPRVRARSDYLAAPNVVHYLAAGSGGAPELVGRWLDEDPTSPWSIPSRRGRVLQRADGAAATQKIADAHARRIGMEARGRGRTATIEGAWQPIIPGDVVDTIDPDRPHVTATWEVEAATWDGDDQSWCRWTLREVTA